MEAHGCKLCEERRKKEAAAVANPSPLVPAVSPVLLTLNAKRFVRRKASIPRPESTMQDLDYGHVKLLKYGSSIGEAHAVR